MKKIVCILVLLVIGIAGGFFVARARTTASIFEDANIENDGIVREDPLPGVHQSYFSDKNFFDDGYAAAAGKTWASEDLKKIHGMIVPHHLLAREYIAAAFAGAQNPEVRTIVLISPNHFSQGKGMVISSEYTWNTAYGVLAGDADLVGNLAAQHLVTVEEKPFEKEHGISGIVPFVKKSFPNAHVIPLIVNDRMTSADVDATAKKIMDALPPDTLYIASFDFTHYAPQTVADFHDAKSGALLQTLDASGTQFEDIDSRPGLRMFLDWMKLFDGKHTMHFVEQAHTSSDTLLGHPESSDNTSYFTGYFAEGGRVETPVATIHAFGDIMLDRHVREAIAAHSVKYLFANVDRFTQGSDLVVANLEGPVTVNKSVATSDNLVFTFNPKSAAQLPKFGITDVSLANNHTYNFGAKGLASTRAFLKGDGLPYFGDPENQSELSRIETVRGMRIGFVGYHAFSGGIQNVIAEIRRIRPTTDFVIVYPHWGTEYQTHSFSKSEQSAAHAFIDAGADVVIGSHPHVVQPFELYKNKMIFYSLGNFIFDQHFSEDVMTELSVGLVVEPTQVTYYLFPLRRELFQPILSDPARRATLLASLAKDSVVPDAMRPQIAQGKIIIQR